MIRTALALFLALTCLAGAAERRPTFEPRPGAAIDSRLVFTEASGRSLSFGQVLAGRPAVVLIGYHKCPNLCGLTQNVVADALGKTGLDTDAARAVFVSIDPAETAADAAGAKAKLAKVLGRERLPEWAFLVGPPGSVAGLTEAIGYRFNRRARIDQFVHPVSVAVVTPQGRLSRLLPALTLDPHDLRLALIEASRNRIGTFADHVLLLCAGFDTTKGQYTPIIGTVLKAGGTLTALALAGLVLLMSRGRRA